MSTAVVAEALAIGAAVEVERLFDHPLSDRSLSHRPAALLSQAVRLSELPDNIGHEQLTDLRLVALASHDVR